MEGETISSGGAEIVERIPVKGELCLETKGKVQNAPCRHILHRHQKKSHRNIRGLFFRCLKMCFFDQV